MPIPACTADAAYQTCISRVRNADLKERLQGACEEIRRADARYRKAGAARDFTGLDAGQCELTDVSADEMARIYDGRMAKQKSPGRAIYDDIMLASPHGLCPLCGQRTAATLDHYLPKSRYAALAVNPANLIPACSDCNKAKSDAVDGTLHPYYDDVEKDVWLRAEHKQVRAASVEFHVDPPACWPPALAERVRRHFRTFGLRRLYAVHAAYEISGQQGRLSRLLATGGVTAIRRHLTEEAESRRYLHCNSWQVALFDCLAGSSWFCSGGFRL